MNVTAKIPFNSAIFGNKSIGDVFAVDDETAGSLINSGTIKLGRNKVWAC